MILLAIQVLIAVVISHTVVLVPVGYLCFK